MRNFMVGVGASVVALTSFGQTPDSGAVGEGDQLAEITVTAERRVESIADVPVSVSVFNSDVIEQAHIQNAQDFLSMTPNVSFQQGGRNGAREIIVSIRGISDIKSGEKIATESAFATYVDEFSVGTLASGQANPSTYDVDTIEVLRGPQGTFFGRNSEGGAINIQTRRPTDKFYGQIDVGAGNYGSYELDGIVNIPVSDKVWIRETLESTKTDGFVRNRNPVGGTSASRYMNSRTQLRWKPTDATTVDLAVTRTIDNQDFANKAATCINPTFGFNPLDPAVLGGIGCYDPRDAIESLLQNSAGLPGGTVPPGLAAGFTKNSGDSIYQNSRTYTDNSNTMVVGRVVHDFSGFSLTSITGQIQSYQDQYLDLDNSGVDSVDRLNGFSAKSWSQELRLASLGDRRLNWTIGGLYHNDKFYAANRIIIKDFLGPWLRDDYANENNIFEGRDGWALFANLNWDITDEWALILGGRYSRDSNEERWSNVYAACAIRKVGDPLSPGCELRPDQVAAPVIEQAPDGTLYTTGGRTAQTIGTYGKNSNSIFTPRVAVRWKPSDRWTAYATVSEGYKAAGVRLNPDSGFDHASYFGVEKLFNYEVGFNARLFNNRLALQGSVFRMDWKDMQVEVQQSLCKVEIPGQPPQLVPISEFTGGTTCVLVPFNGVENAKKARSQGVEFSAQAILGRGWRAGGSVGFLDAKFISYLAELANTSADLSGHRLAQAPRWTVTGFGEYRWPVGGSADAFIRGDVLYRSSVALGVAEQVNTVWPEEVPGYVVGNLAAGVNFENQSITVNVRNLFNRDYFTGVDGFSYGGTMVDVNPRTFFVKWTWKTR